MKIAIGSDHRGLDLKAGLIEPLTNQGHRVEDIGAFDSTSVDYPDIAAVVGRLCQSGDIDRGILICGTGIGMSIAANRFSGVRAAVCHDRRSAELSRLHNDANVLCLSADLVSSSDNEAIAALWFDTGFDAGRHQRRIEKIEHASQPMP